MAALKLTEQELKLTAIVYCRHGAGEHLRKTGKLPKRIGGPGSVIAMRVLLEERGTTPTLSADERAMYDAIVREGRLPGGAVRLVVAKDPGVDTTSAGVTTTPIEPVTHLVACVFSAQMSFADNEVRKAMNRLHGRVVPRKSALAGVAREFKGYLEQRFSVDRVQADVRSISLLGVARGRRSMKTIDPDSGHPATMVPAANCRYDYRIAFDALIEFPFPGSPFASPSKGAKRSIFPSKKAMRLAAEELRQLLSRYVFIDRLEVLPNGSMYFMMLDAGAIQRRGLTR